MWFAKSSSDESLYFVDTDSFGYIHEDIEEGGDGLEVYDEIDGDINQPVLNWWNGNNWELKFLRYAPEEIEYGMSENQPEQSEPAYYESMRVIIDGEEIEISQSNMSGAITPYWTEHVEY